MKSSLNGKAPVHGRKVTTKVLASHKLKPNRGDPDLLSRARYVRRAVGYGFVQVHIAVSDFDVKPAIGIATHPCLVMYWSPLASEVRQGE